MRRSSPISRPLSAALFGAFVSVTPCALADAPQPAALSWVRAAGAETCPTAQEVSREVEQLLGGAGLVPLTTADLVVEALIAPSGGLFETVFTLADRSGAALGSRRLTTAGDDCPAALGEIGLVIALMIDPEAPVRAAPPPAVRETERGPVGASEPASKPPALQGSLSPPLPPSRPLSGWALVQRSASRWGARVSLGPVLSVGLLPSPGAGVRLRAGVSPPGGFPIEIDGRLFAGVRTEELGRGAEMSLALAGVRLCPVRATSERWEIDACAGLDVGHLRAAGFGFPVNRAPDMAFGAVAAGGRAALAVGGPVRVLLGVEIAAPLSRGRFFQALPDGSRSEVTETSVVVGSLDLALGFAL